MADSIATLVLRIVAHNATGPGFAGVRSGLAGVRGEAALAAATLGAGVAAGTVAAIKQAADFQRTMVQTAALTGQTAGQVGASNRQMAQGFVGTSRQVLDAVDRTGQSARSLGEALYFIMSSGFTKAADAEKLMVLAGKDATIGHVEGKVAADALTTALNAYGASADQAARYNDILLQGVNLGKAEFGDFARSLGNVLPLAAQAGIRFGDITSALATLTLSGLSPRRSALDLNRLIQSILAPTKGQVQMGAALGIDFSKADLSTPQGLLHFLDLVRAKVAAFPKGEQAEIFKKLFSNQAAILGAQILTNNIANLQHNQDVMNQTVGAGTVTTRAYAAVSGTLSAQFQKLQAELGKAAIIIGGQLSPLALRLVHVLGALLPGAVRALSAAIQGVLHPTAGWRTAMQGAAVVASSFAHTLGLVGQATRALAAAIVGTLAPLGQHNRATAQGTTHLRQIGAALALAIPLLVSWRVAVGLAHVAQAAWGVAMGAWRVATLAAHAVVLLFRGAILAWRGVVLLAHGATVAWTAAQWLFRAAMVAGNVVVLVGRGIVLAYTLAMGLLRAAVLAATVGGARFLAQQILINTWNVTVRGATLLWTAAQWLLNAALTANPIGIVVVAIGALVAALILAWNHSKTLRDLLTGFWAWLSGVFAGGLKNVGEGIKNFLGGAFQFVADKITWFMDKMRGLLTLASHLPKIGDFAKAALAALDALEGRPPGATGGRLIGPPVPAWLRARQQADVTALDRGGAAAPTTTARHVVHHVVEHVVQHVGAVTPAQHRAVQDLLAGKKPPPERTPEQAAILDFHTAMTRFAGQKGLDPNDVARMAADLAKIAAADPAKAAQLQAQLENATQRRHETIAHHGAVVAHHRQVLAQRATHHARVVAHHAQVAAHHAAVRAAHADAATLLRTIHNEIREHRFAQAARDITRFRGLETTALRAAGLDPTRAAREAGVITRGLQDELATAERGRGRAGRPVALQDAVDRFKTDLLQLGTSARDHARLLADVARIRADEVAAHYRGARVALDLAENSKKVADHFKIIAAARQPVAPVPRYGALAGETGYGQTTVSFGGAQASPWQAMVAALREQITHLRAQLAKDDHLIALLEVGNATDGQQLGVLRSIDGHIGTPGPPHLPRSAHSVLKAAGSYAPVTR